VSLREELQKELEQDAANGNDISFGEFTCTISAINSGLKKIALFTPLTQGA
jgi:hypothetical protein